MEYSLCAGKGEHLVLWSILFNGDHARENISVDREIPSISERKAYLLKKTKAVNVFQTDGLQWPPSYSPCILLLKES